MNLVDAPWKFRKEHWHRNLRFWYDSCCPGSVLGDMAESSSFGYTRRWLETDMLETEN
jgi:hypothetical protein